LRKSTLSLHFLFTSSKKSKKQKRSSKPCSRAKKDEHGNRLWKAMLFKHKDEPVALDSLIASINSTVDKTNCAENSGKRLLFSTTRRIARAKQFPRGTAFGHSLFCPGMAYMYSHMNAQDQVDTILRPMTLLWPSAQDRLQVAVSARTSKSERLQAHRSATSQQRGSRSVESRLPFPCAEVCLVGRYQNAQLLY
jgi:hypothetical protein